MTGELLRHSVNRPLNFNRFLGRFLDMANWDPSVCKSNRLHVDILQVSFITLGISSKNSYKMIGNFPAVVNFNRLFLKLNRFICNKLPVLPDHRSRAQLLVAFGDWISFLAGNVWSEYSCNNQHSIMTLG